MTKVKIANSKNISGQGALEYLLIIGVAIIVVAIVIIMLSGLASGPGDGSEVVTQSLSDLQILQFERSTGLKVNQELSLSEPGVNRNLDYLFQFNEEEAIDTKDGKEATHNSAIFKEEDGLWDTGAYFFDSSNEDETYVQISQSIKENVTYSMWIKPTKQKNTDSYFFAGIRSLASDGYNPNSFFHGRQTLVLRNDNTIRLRHLVYGCSTPSPQQILITSKDKINLNEWSNVVWSIDFNSDNYWTNRLYLNGVLQEKVTRDNIENCNDQIAVVWLGRRKGSSNQNTNFDGYIEEFVRWERVLSEDEIRNFYIKGSASFPK